MRVKNFGKRIKVGRVLASSVRVAKCRNPPNPYLNNQGTGQQNNIANCPIKNEKKK